jgi:hypothetical protein
MGERVTMVWDVEADIWSASWHNEAGIVPLGMFRTIGDAMRRAQEAIADAENAKAGGAECAEVPLNPDDGAQGA